MWEGKRVRFRVGESFADELALGPGSRIEVFTLPEEEDDDGEDWFSAKVMAIRRLGGGPGVQMAPRADDDEGVGVRRSR
ncbi:hypothetical protein T484DRAFT_1905699, partial [Baffinella frigidus]